MQYCGVQSVTKPSLYKMMTKEVYQVTTEGNVSTTNGAACGHNADFRYNTSTFHWKL